VEHRKSCFSKRLPDFSDVLAKSSRDSSTTNAARFANNAAKTGAFIVGLSRYSCQTPRSDVLAFCVALLSFVDEAHALESQPPQGGFASGCPQIYLPGMGAT